jgi:hypothetical protein
LPAEPSPAEPQGVYGVFADYNFQAYAGYTFYRFYVLPNDTLNMNGFNFSVVYYPKNGKIGADGELVAVFGSQAGTSAQFVTGMGGARVRWSGPRAVEIWVHGMAGGGHLIPQTPYGGQNAFGWAAGGGIDYTPRNRRLGYRVQADAVAMYFFGTHQYSPKISFGVVYKF